MQAVGPRPPIPNILVFQDEAGLDRIKCRNLLDRAQALLAAPTLPPCPSGRLSVLLHLSTNDNNAFLISLGRRETNYLVKPHQAYFISFQVNPFDSERNVCRKTDDHQWSCLFQSVGRYPHVQFTFYLTNLVLTAPFQCNATSTTSIHQHYTTNKPKNGHGDREYYPSRQLFCSLTVFFDHRHYHLPFQHIRQMEAKGEDRGQGMGANGTSFLLIFHSILLTTMTGIPSATSDTHYSNEDTASQVLPPSSCRFLSFRRDGKGLSLLVLLRGVSVQRGG